MVGFIVCIIILVLVAACLSVLVVILKRRNRKYKDFILHNSSAVRRLNEINSEYIFYPYINYNQSYHYDNRNFYDDISCRDYLVYQLQTLQDEICSQIIKIRKNKKQYAAYSDEVNKLVFGQYTAPAEKLSRRKLQKTEHKEVDKLIQRPAVEFTLYVCLYYEKMNGHVVDYKDEKFSEADILKLVSKVEHKRGNFYLDRDIWDSICRVERGKVSNKMRFYIYDRDGHRCCRCGIYAPLDMEIDHIIPISKGGKSTPDNLQTLCHRCNVEKGNS